MSRLYSTQLYAGGEFSGDVGPFSPPSGTIWVVRHVAVTVYEIGSQTVNCYLSSGPVVWQVVLDGSPFFVQFESRAVLLESDGIHLNATAGATVLMSGYQLTTP